MEKRILAVLTKIRHPFLQQLHCAFQSEHFLFLQSPYYPGGDLSVKLAESLFFPTPRAKLYLAEIALGLSELHRLGIIYR